MKSSFAMMLLACCISATPLFGQEKADRKAGQYFVIPPNILLLAIASQPECPLLIESARILRSSDAKSPGFYNYQVRNRGTRAITSFTLSIWYSDATGATLNPVRLEQELLPTQSIVFPFKNDEFELVPLTDELRDKQRLNKPYETLAVIMVEYVHFSDGSIYHAEELSSVVQNYFLKINGFPVGVKSKRTRHRRL